MHANYCTNLCNFLHVDVTPKVLSPTPLPSIHTEGASTKYQRDLALVTHRLHTFMYLPAAISADAAASRRDVLRAALYAVPTDKRIMDGEDHQPLTPVSIAPLVAWFTATFKRTDEPVKANTGAGSSNWAMQKADALVQVIATKTGSEEQLAGVFAAMLRSMGHVTRTVHVLPLLSKAVAAQEKVIEELEAQARAGPVRTAATRAVRDLATKRGIFKALAAEIEAERKQQVARKKQTTTTKKASPKKAATKPAERYVCVVFFA